MVLNAYARSATDRVVMPIARRLVQAGATANWLTFSGMAATVLGVVVLLTVGPRSGAVVLALATATDAFDGAVARLRGSASPFGAFLDSVCDRVSDAVILGAAAWLVRDDPLLFGVAIVALAGAMLTSYVRAKAESLGWDATVGIIERPERVMIIVLAFFFELVPLGLWVLAVGALVTVGQRFRVVLAQVDRT